MNEAFASQFAYCVQQLGIPIEQINPNGGAIAISHPLAMSELKSFRAGTFYSWNRLGFLMWERNQSQPACMMFALCKHVAALLALSMLFSPDLLACHAGHVLFPNETVFQAPSYCASCFASCTWGTCALPPFSAKGVVSKSE